jgi:hypothetical protein
MLNDLDTVIHICMLFCGSTLQKYNVLSEVHKFNACICAWAGPSSDKRDVLHPKSLYTHQRTIETSERLLNYVVS